MIENKPSEQQPVSVKWEVSAESFNKIKSLGVDWEPAPMGTNIFSVKTSNGYQPVHPGMFLVRLPLKENQRVPGTYNSWVEEWDRPDFIVLTEKEYSKYQTENHE